MGGGLARRPGECFSIGGRGDEVTLHLAITRDILVVTNGEWGTATDICWLEDRDAGKHPTSTGHSHSKGSWPKCQRCQG